MGGKILGDKGPFNHVGSVDSVSSLGGAGSAAARKMKGSRVKLVVGFLVSCTVGAPSDCSLLTSAENRNLGAEMHLDSSILTFGSAR